MTNQSPEAEKPLIIIFLQRLNVARRYQSTYPPGHPAISESISKTLTVLQEFFPSSPTISIGIGPAAIYFEQIKFTDNDPSVADFCHFFSHLGIATVTFQAGITADELIRFNQLLRSDREQIESFGGFSSLLAEQRIGHIQVIAIDYEAFQAKALDNGRDLEAQDLWENFLFGLSQGILDFDSESEQQLAGLAQMLNYAQTDISVQTTEYQHKLTDFIDHSLYADRSKTLQVRAGIRINHLLQQLSSEARDHFLTNIIQALNKNPEPAENILSGISPQYFNATLASLSRDKHEISTRLVNLLDLFSNNNSPAQYKLNSLNDLSTDVLKARLDELFREEQQEAYLPSQYQTALKDVFSDNVIPELIPDDVQTELRELIESQSIEHHFSQIIIRLIENPLAKEYETAAQDHLLELTKFYLDTGHFKKLKEIFRNWTSHLNSGYAHLDIFAEKVIAAQSQKSFITEVLDGFEIWEKGKHADLTTYIQEVGEPYVAAIIERLGLAPKKEERMLWLQILKSISSDAQQTIIEALNDDRWYLIRNLLSVLRQTPNQMTLKASLPFCTHNHPMVRIEAIGNLLMSNPATGNRYLQQELRSDDPQTKEAALKITSLSKDPVIIDILHSLLQSPAASDTELNWQLTAAQSLGQIAQPETLVIFRRLLRKKGFFMSQRVKTLQQEIIKTLPKFSGSAVEKLVKELSKSKYKEQLQTAFSDEEGGPHEIY